MDYTQIRKFCKKHGVRLPSSWVHSYNAIRYHNKEETREHFRYKSEVGLELMKQGQTIFSELMLEKVGTSVSKRMKFPTADLFWLEELMILEFESNYNEHIAQFKYQQFKPFNVFVFDIKKISVDEILEKIGLEARK